MKLKLSKFKCSKCKKWKIRTKFPTSNTSWCKDCHYEFLKFWRHIYPDKVKQYNATHNLKQRTLHKDKINLTRKEKRHKLGISIKYREEMGISYTVGYKRFKRKQYKVNKLQRCPKWSDLEAIKQFYLNCPKGKEVDHIVPLQGKIVSGLHVLNNLQYLTKKQNLRKGNRHVK